MSKLWRKDGLSRKQRIINTQWTGSISLLNNDFHTLSRKAFVYASAIRFYNYSNQSSGHIQKAFKYSVFYTISYIRGIDLLKEEQDFLRQLENDFCSHRKKQEQIIRRLHDYIILFDEWIRNVSYFESNGCKLTLGTDLINQVITNLQNPVSDLIGYCKLKSFSLDLSHLSNIWEIDEQPSKISDSKRFFKNIFFRLHNSISIIQTNIDFYEKEIIESGYMDPATGLLAAFFNNLNKIADSFNKRWEQFPDFYLNEILKVTPAQPIPDYTFLKLNKTDSSNDLLIPKDSIFQSADGVKFRNKNDYIISNIALKRLFCLYDETNPEIEPSSSLGFSTAFRLYNHSDLIDRPISSVNSPKSLFGHRTSTSDSTSKWKNISYTPLGLLIRSWSLLLREGERNLALNFILNESSFHEFKEMIDSICAKFHYQVLEAIYKVLHNIFHIEISTETGWMQVHDFSVEMSPFRNASALVINIHFAEDFPAICALPEENPSSPPGLRIMINRNTWMYPYSWLKTMNYEKLIIRTKVQQLSNIQVYSELGRIDTSMPFYPFGVMPKKGAWMVFGSYEMAVKNIISLNLHARWSDLPDDEYGFFSYYNQYPGKISNCSFRVVPQLLKNRKWLHINESPEYFLFNTITQETAPETEDKAPLSADSHLMNIFPKEQIPVGQKEEEFAFNMFTGNGFFRLMLSAPSTGFGHLQYQKLISDVLMQKVRTKKQIDMPNLPYAPQMEHFSVDYSSEEELHLAQQTSQIYHLQPFGTNLLNNAKNINHFCMVPSISGQANLLFGLDHVNGGEIIRLFVDMHPLEKEIDKTLFPKIRWYSGNGYQWEPLSPQSIIQDDTRNFLVSGNIEISLPNNLQDQSNSIEELYWLRASIEENAEAISDVNGIYLHVIQVERLFPEDSSGKFIPVPALSITEATPKIMGLEEIIQLKNSAGGRLPESHRMMQVRLAERISHRNRAVTAHDYERLILENFTSVKKVKCFPGIDSKGKRPGTVTIAIIERNRRLENNHTPKANCQLLLDIEDFLQSYTSMFANVDLINPIYEYLQVRCKVIFQPNLSEGYYLRKLNEEINHYIAFWEQTDDPPVFGNTVSVIELANFIRSRDYVVQIENFSLIHLSEEQENSYELQELEEFEAIQEDCDSLDKSVRILLNNEEVRIRELEPIRATKPWGILVPLYSHHLSEHREDQTEKIGIDELEIGNTFVIQ